MTIGDDDVVIVAARRTPMGAFLGDFAKVPAARLGAAAIAAAVADAGLDPARVDRAVMGCVLGAGQGQAPARQAARGAGLPDSVPAVTVNKMCGSGMQAVMDAHDAIRAGSASVVVAGGMESMSNAPYLLPRARTGFRMGHGEVKDSMFLDGLEDAYESGRLMGSFAEDCARHYQFTRAAQDAFALQSLDRAKAAIAAGQFAREVTVLIEVTVDEQPGKARPEKIPTLKPAFAPDGTVTAANASSISDGAAALVLMQAATAREMGLTIRARIVGHAGHAQAPANFATAPAPAIEKLLARTGLSVRDVDLWEINEAFAVVTMAATRDLELDPARVNTRGGACALGHPIGASGARILVTLLHALEDTGARLGVAALCIGGGEATAMAIERA